MAWLVFDSVSALYGETRPDLVGKLTSRLRRCLSVKAVPTDHELLKLQAERIMSNPAMQRAWSEWGLRDEWERSEFQRFMDDMAQRWGSQSS